MVFKGDLFHLTLNLLLFKATANPDQMLGSAASDLGLHCLPVSQSMFLKIWLC